MKVTGCENERGGRVLEEVRCCLKTLPLTSLEIQHIFSVCISDNRRKGDIYVHVLSGM